MTDGNSGASPAPVRSNDARAVELVARFGRRLELFATRHLGADSAVRNLVDGVLAVARVHSNEGRVCDADLTAFVLSTARAMVRDHRRGGRCAGDRVGRAQRRHGIDLARLRRANETLPEAERSIVLLTYYGQRSAQEIAEVVGLSADSIRGLRERALSSLRGCMEERPAMRSTSEPLPSFGELVDYWLGELDEASARTVEHRLFADDAVAAEVDRLARLEAALVELPIAGPSVGVVAPLLDQMEDEGVPLRVYRLEPGETVPGTVGREPFVVVRLRAAFEGQAMVDLESVAGDRAPTFRRGLIVDAAASELVLLDASEALGELPACTLLYRLWSREAAPRLLGEFRLAYAPPAGRSGLA